MLYRMANRRTHGAGTATLQTIRTPPAGAPDDRLAPGKLLFPPDCRQAHAPGTKVSKRWLQEWYAKNVGRWRARTQIRSGINADQPTNSVAQAAGAAPPQVTGQEPPPASSRSSRSRQSPERTCLGEIRVQTVGEAPIDPDREEPVLPRRMSPGDRSYRSPRP